MEVRWTRMADALAAAWERLWDGSAGSAPGDRRVSPCERSGRRGVGPKFSDEVSRL